MTKIENRLPVEVSEVAANCNALLTEIARTGKGVLITKNGKPHVELKPHRSQKPGIRKVRGKPHLHRPTIRRKPT